MDNEPNSKDPIVARDRFGGWVKMPAQTTSLPVHQASRRGSPIALDGKLDEQDWQVAYVTEGFRQTFPNYLAEAQGLTRVRILFDEKTFTWGRDC